jgi:hypothetical protein
MGKNPNYERRVTRLARRPRSGARGAPALSGANRPIAVPVASDRAIDDRSHRQLPTGHAAVHGRAVRVPSVPTRFRILHRKSQKNRYSQLVPPAPVLRWPCRPPPSWASAGGVVTWARAPVGRAAMATSAARAAAAGQRVFGIDGALWSTERAFENLGLLWGAGNHPPDARSRRYRGSGAPVPATTSTRPASRRSAGGRGGTTPRGPG